MLAAEAVAFDEDPDAEAREVDDHGKDGDCCNEVHDDGRVLTPEGLTYSAALVVLGEEVEKGDDSTLELRGPSVPRLVLTVVGENTFQTVDSQIRLFINAFTSLSARQSSLMVWASEGRSMPRAPAAAGAAGSGTMPAARRECIV